MTTVRLDAKSEAALKRLSVRRGQTKFKVIRDASGLAEEESGQPSAYQRLQPFIGIVNEGDPQLSDNTGKRLCELLESRQGARHSD